MGPKTNYLKPAVGISFILSHTHMGFGTQEKAEQLGGGAGFPVLGLVAGKSLPSKTAHLLYWIGTYLN